VPSNGISGESRPPERLDYMKGNNEIKSLKNSTVVCERGLRGNVYRQVAGSREYGNERSV
jgi:hypothetical protein